MATTKDKKSRKFTMVSIIANLCLLIVAVSALIYVISLETPDINKTIYYFIFGILTLSFGTRLIFNILKVDRERNS
ncbi:hypothetical protein [Paucisalibacillus globulus]|uniref:hypothetical protein n=1 Tax=Paucisalibacillus globulus TaxID=351095 RepID=UPI00047C408E|nr:hypothetical protein [Paucisalibacillus globulus]